MTTPLDLALTTIGLDELAFDRLIANPSPIEETRQRLLCFPLGERDSALLALEHIAQVFRIEVVEILPIPEMSDCVLGIGNWQGEMLWLVDLPAFAGYPSLVKQQVPESLIVIVIQVNDKTLGLVVQQVNDVELHDLQQIQPATIGLFLPSFLPFVLGTLPGSSHAVLDVNAIASYTLWQQPWRIDP
jgi:positive phototaxis protein PixI